MKGLAIDVVQAIIIMVFVLLLVTFLFSGIWKDVITKFGNNIGIEEPTKIEGVISTSDRVDINCEGAVIGGNNGYRYQIGVQNLKIRIENPKDIVPLILFKDKTALSYNQQGGPEHIPESAIENGEGVNLLYTIETMSPPVTNEFLTIAVFEKNDNCIDIARAGSAEDTFAACARFLIGLTKLTVSSAAQCSGLHPLGRISDISGNPIGSSSCYIDYKMTNMGGINWMPEHKIKSVLRCIGTKYVPQAPDMYVVDRPLPPQGSIQASFLTIPARIECPLWDAAKQQLEGTPEWEQFKDGWKIELYYGCDNNNCDPSKKMDEVSFKKECTRCLRYDTYNSCIASDGCYWTGECSICTASTPCSLFDGESQQCLQNKCGGTKCEWRSGTGKCLTDCDVYKNDRNACTNAQHCYYLTNLGTPDCKSCTPSTACTDLKEAADCKNNKCGLQCYSRTSTDCRACSEIPQTCDTRDLFSCETPCNHDCYMNMNSGKCDYCASRNPPLRCEDIRDAGDKCAINICGLDCNRPVLGFMCETCPQSGVCSDYDTPKRCADCNYPKNSCRWDGSSCVNR